MKSSGLVTTINLAKLSWSL